MYLIEFIAIISDAIANPMLNRGMKNPKLNMNDNFALKLSFFSVIFDFAILLLVS